MTCSNSDIEVVRVLMEHDATMTPSHEGISPLSIACFRVDIELIAFLTENGADVNAESDKDGYNPINMGLSFR